MLTRPFCSIVLVFALLAGLSAPLQAQDIDKGEYPKQWHITGNTSSHFENYTNRGSGGTIFGSTGNQLYQDLNFTLEREFSPFDRTQIEFGGLWNNSKYRSQDWGNVLERVRILREKGDGATPYRYELGDFYGNFSNRTMQRSLKGLQLELQPRIRGMSRESFILVLGQSDPDWRNLHKDRDRTAGLSWLLQRTNGLKLNINWVFADRDANAAIGALDRRQNVYSMAFEKATHLFGKKALVESEVAWFSGDHNGVTTPASGQDKRGRGAYARLSGGENPFVYHFRYEANTQDFRPFGAYIAPDRRSGEGFLTWNLKGGRNASLRYQHFKDNWETVNPLVTSLVGLSFRGPISDHDRLQGALDAFIENQDNRNNTTDNKVRSIVADLNKTFSERFSGRLSYSYRDLDSHINNLIDNRVSQVILGLDHSIHIGDMPGRVGLNLDHRFRDTGGFQANDWTPALSMNLQKNGHDLGMYYRFQKQNEKDPTRVDVETNDANLRYQRHIRQHTYGLEYLANRRTDSNGLWARSYQVNVFYNYDFDTDIRFRGHQLAVYQAGAATGTFATMLTDLRLNGAYNDALNTVSGQLGGKSRKLGNLNIFETTYFDDVAYRQRLAMVNENDRLTRASLVIDTNRDFPGQIMDAFERIRRELIRRYGAPDNLHERGPVNPSLLSDIRDGTFVRNYDWHLPSGTMRLGLPKRIDGRVVIEIAVKESFPSPVENIWGLERFD